MLTVIKRSGVQQPFDAEKIKQSLIATGDEAKTPLNNSDIQDILNDVLAVLEGKEKVLSQHIFIILIGVLTTKGLTKIAESYMNFEKTF